MRHSSRRFRPRLDGLADRALPSATIGEVAGVLSVRGNADANTIAITDDGSAGAGNVTVVADGTTYTSAGAVRRIRVFSGGGADTVGYSLTSDLAAGQTRSVTINAGPGDDVYTADLLAGVATGSRLDMSVYAGGGDDTLTVTGGLVDVAAGARLNLDLYGDGGDDQIVVDLAGLVEGRVDVGVFGGNGNDFLTADLTADAGSPGGMFARMKGGAGRDDMAMYLNAGSWNSFGVIYADATDTIDATDNVVVVTGAGEWVTTPPFGFGR